MLTIERIDRIRHAMYRFGAANSWTGTSGTLAAMIQDLLSEREELLALVSTLERRDDEHLPIVS